MNRHKQQSEKAKELIEKLRTENGKSFDEDEVRKFLKLLKNYTNFPYRTSDNNAFVSTHDD